MRRQLRWYGASPLHLLALLACFGLAGYAAARLIPSQPLGVAAWFLGAVIGHDLLLMPLYSLADRSVMAAIRHREPQLPVTPWINYVRVPAALSGLLLLVWFPLILRLQSPYHASTTLSADPYLWHWLAVTGALSLLSAVAFALRLRGKPRTASPPERPAVTPGSVSPDLPPGTSPGLPGTSPDPADGIGPDPAAAVALPRVDGAVRGSVPLALAGGDGRAVPAVSRRVRATATPSVANRRAAGTPGRGTRRQPARRPAA